MNVDVRLVVRGHDGVEWTAVVFEFVDGTTLDATRRRDGRWAISSGFGWAHALELVEQRLVTVEHHGPGTFGHVEYLVDGNVVERLLVERDGVPA